MNKYPYLNNGKNCIIMDTTKNKLISFIRLEYLDRKIYSRTNKKVKRPLFKYPNNIIITFENQIGADLSEIFVEQLCLTPENNERNLKNCRIITFKTYKTQIVFVTEYCSEYILNNRNIKYLANHNRELFLQFAATIISCNNIDNIEFRKVQQKEIQRFKKYITDDELLMIMTEYEI